MMINVEYHSCDHCMSKGTKPAIYEGVRLVPTSTVRIGYGKARCMACTAGANLAVAAVVVVQAAPEPGIFDAVFK